MSSIERDPLGVIIRLLSKNYSKAPDARETYEVIANRMQSILDDPQELIAFLGQHLKPKELEKKQNGEVFTPPSLINEKFDKLTEIAPEIWSNPNLKFFDPANGIGNYPALAFHRLMEGLKEVIPDEKERKKHILEKMLYMCELSKKNVEVSRKLFDPENEYKLNLHQGDFLELDPFSVWGIDKFDVIFGNPPYNAPSKNGKATGNTIYPKFLLKIPLLLKENGYQVMVHPGIWRKPGNKLHDIMFDRQIHYLEIHSDTDGQKLFKAATRYEWYILQQKSVDASTKIKFTDGVIEDIRLDGLPLLVNRGFSIWQKMAQKAQRDGSLNVIRGGSIFSKKCSKKADSKNIYPCVNSTQRKEGVIYLFHEKPHEDQFSKKVIFANNRNVLPFYDSGLFGVTEQGLYQLVNSEGEGLKLCRFLSSKLVRYIIASSKWSMFRTEYETFKYIPGSINLPENFTDADLYSYFGLSDEEIVRIESDQKMGLENYIHLEAPVISVPDEELSSPLSQLKISELSTDYTKLTVKELKILCQERKIPGFNKKKKEELIALLNDSQPGTSPQAKSSRVKIVIRG